MSVIDTVKETVKPKVKLPAAVPADIDDRIQRGRIAMLKDASARRVCQKFWEGEHYWYVNSKNALAVLPSAVVAVEAGKPLHRVRNTYNFAASIIEGKVSAATQKVPGYEVTPSTGDPEDDAAARLSAQVAVFGYDKWRLRRHTTKAITNALVQREGFVMPYFDQNVGPFEQGSDGKYEGQGELKFLDLSRSEVMWEPGVDFDDSRWHAIERAQTPEDVKSIPGFIGIDLSADARTSDLPSGKTSETMIRVTEYLERPCPKYPEGRRCFIAANRIIVDYRKVDELAEDWYEPFPCMDPDGEVLDEPVIHRISYTVNPEGDDLGLMERLIDLSRTVNDCWNKLLEWKNRCLMPQMVAPMGSQFTQANDIPGYVYRYAGSQEPKWQQTPPVPRELIDLLELAISHMRALASDVDVQPVADLAAKTANAAVEQSAARWQSFLGDTAEFHSRLMRHCLSIVAREYTEERQIAIRGTHGSQPLDTFTGQDMRSQVNVRVLPGSIESKSRQTVMDEIRFIVELWGPEALRPEMAMSAFHGGNAEGLFKSYDLHKARAWALVQKVRTDFHAVMNMPPRGPDVEMGDPQFGFMVPGWMPRKQDNLVVWKQVIADYMIEPDFDAQPPEVQHFFDLIWDGLEQLEQRKAMMLQAQAMDAAAEQGAANAAAPQGAIPMPQQQGMTREQAAPEAGTPKA